MPFDWIRTPAGEKHLQSHQPTSDYIESFRNISQASPGRDMRLPPSLRPFYFDEFPSEPTNPRMRGPGMMNVQRHLDQGKGLTTVEAANQVPIHSPRFTIDRDKQHMAWHGGRKGKHKPGQRSLHATLGGSLSLSEAQQYLMGDMAPQDTYDYEITTSPTGDVSVVDETGQEVPKVTYWPFDRDEHGQVVYRDDPSAPMEAESAIRGERTLAQSERFGRPLPHQMTGSGDWVMIPQEGADPIPIPMRSTFQDHLGITTPKGVFFPEGVDYTDIVRRSASLEELADVLMKAISDDPDDWEEMFDWDPRFGGSAPTGKESGTKALGGGGSQEVWDWINANPNIVDAWLGGKGEKGRQVDWPLEGQEIVPWSEYRQEEGIGDRQSRQSALAAHSGYSNPGAMPGIGVQDFPARACLYSTPDDPNSACGHCYACENNFRFNNVQVPNWARLDQTLTDPMKVASALQETMYQSAQPFAPGRNMPAPVRWKSSGDKRGAGEFSMGSDVMSQMPSHEMMEHWIATRQYRPLLEYLDARGWEDEAFPDNARVRLSLPGRQTMDDDLPDIIEQLLSHRSVVPTSFDAVGEGMAICPKTTHGNRAKCDANIDPLTGELGCRACWDPDVGIVYGLHEGGQKRQWTPEEMKSAFRGFGESQP